MNKVLNYGKIILENSDLKNERKTGFINNDYDNFELSDINNIINIKNYTIYFMKKENSVGFYMNWHIDDAQIVKRKNGLDGQIKISDKHYLHYNKNKPKYTIIIYGSDYNIDFKGGLLEFADGSIIEPKKNYYILFNSDELHRVHKITKGTRKNILIKLYEKDCTKDHISKE